MTKDHAAIVLEAHRLRDEYVAQMMKNAFAALGRLFARKRPVGKPA